MMTMVSDPIYIDRKTKLTHENEEKIYQELENTWDKLDKDFSGNCPRQSGL